MRSPSSLFGAALLASVASASPAPQQLDFAQLMAAPSVASGPQAQGGSNQTATLATSFAVTGAAATAGASRREVAARQGSNSYVNSQYNAGLGSAGSLTSINPGNLYWLSGGNTHNIQGNVNNYGSLYISQTSYLKTNPNAGGQTCKWEGHDANNGNLQNFAGALIQLNDITAKTAATHSWKLHSLCNNGTIQWCGRGDTGGSTFQFYSDIDAINNGLISYEQVHSNMGASFTWGNLNTGSSGQLSNIYNNGAFRLLNVVHHCSQNVYGSGCWQIGVGATLYLESGAGLNQNAKKASAFAGQSITFSDSSAVLHMESGVYSQNSQFGAAIYGFGSGNCFEFYEVIRSFSYSASGYLKVSFWSGNTVSLNIGGGYDASKFYISWNPSKYNSWGFNGIFYKGSCPSKQSPPPTCSMGTPPCGDLGSSPPSPPTYSSPPKYSAPVSSPVATPTTAPAIVSTPVYSSTPVTSAVSVPVTSAPATVPVTSVPSAPSYVSSTSPAVTSPTDTAYTPYYPALSTTVVSGVSTTVSSTTACPTTPENGTYCGFINPEDPCAPQPDGYGPVPTPDTPSAFLAYPPFHAMASAAPSAIPAADGTTYSQTFRDLNASSSAQSYLGLITLKSYDATACAAQCDGVSICTAFNIYIERDPSLNPTNNDSTAPTVWGYDCPNPASMTTYKCTLWGSELDASTATNAGETREQFQVVITGSNGYDKTNATIPQQPSGPSTTDVPTSTAVATYYSSSPATPAPVSSSVSSAAGGIPPYSPPAPASSSPAVYTSPATPATSTSPLYPKPTPSKCPSPWNKPKTCHGKGVNYPSGWLGSNFFPGPYNPQVCSDYALAQNAANKQSAIAAGKHSYPACQMFNAYYLHKNGKPHGTICALFSADLDVSYATYSGGYYNGFQFDIHASWTFALTVPDSGKC